MAHGGRGYGEHTALGALKTLKTPDTGAPPPPHSVHPWRVTFVGVGDKDQGGASARRSPLRGRQAPGPQRPWAPFSPGCEERQVPPTG